MTLLHRVLALLAVGLLASCGEKGPTLADLSARHEILERETAEIRLQLNELRRAVKTMLDSKQQAFDQFAEGIRSLNETSESIRTTLEAFAAYKREYRKKAREKAPGTALGDVTVGTQTLREAVIREVTDTHVSFRHASGTTRVPLTEAPPDLQARYGFDPALDLVIAKAEGTGTDWLLSAMAAVEQLTDPASLDAPTVMGSRPAKPSATSGVSASPSYSSSTTRPAWAQFSNFTGSYWAPLQQRKQRVGSVNTWRPSASLIDY